MKTNRFCVIVIAGLLLLATGCTPRKSMEISVIEPDSIVVEKSVHLFNDENKPHCELSIHFIYPKNHTNEEALKELQGLFCETLFGEEYALLSPQEAVDKYTKQYIDEYKTLEEDYEEQLSLLGIDDAPDIPIFSYMEELNTSIEFNDKGILSFTAYRWSYTGGAHGTGNTLAYNINLNTRMLVEESDIFTENSKDGISQLIIRKLMEEHHVNSQEELENAGFFDLNGIVPNNNFILNGEGVSYIYNQYEIAPYSMGNISVSLSYKEIEPYLKKDSPISALLKTKI